MGGLRPDQEPPAHLLDFVVILRRLISSTRLRAIERPGGGQGKAFTRDEVLIQWPLPPPRWPSWIKLSPFWGFLARFHWWFFNHHQGEENRKQAEARADQAAAKLEAIAEGGQNVVVLAHGFFNVLIDRALRKRQLAAGQPQEA